MQMEGSEARRRLLRWGQYAFSLALTLLGLLLIRAALRYPATEPPPATTRAAFVESSSRGSRVAGRRWLALEEQALEAEAPATPPPHLAVARHPSFRSPRGWPGFRGLGGPASADQPQPSPTEIPPRTEVVTYVVQPGDNVYLISQRYGVSQDTIIWANDWLEMDPDLLSIGEELAILPVSGVWHTVKSGETLATIAQRYQVTPEEIVAYAPNGLQEPVSLAVGQKLIIPGGVKPFEPRLVHTQAGTITVNARPEPGRFIWPCNGAITQYFSKQHLAIDIGNSAGTPIYAADSGTVELAGWYGGLGNAVRINHGNGYVTTYGHLRAILVEEGQWVQRGQQIGEMGSTGKSSGPHVHFMVYYYGGAVNPVRYLPPP